MIQVLFLLVWLFGVAGLVNARAANPETSPPVLLRVQGLPSESATDPSAMAEQAVTTRFHGKFPGIRIQASDGLRIQNMNTEATTMMMIAGGIAPDMIKMNLRSSDTFKPRLSASQTVISLACPD